MGSTILPSRPEHRMHRVMASKVLFATLVAAASAAGPPAPYAPQEAYPDLPPVYNYQYGVNDPEYSGAVLSQQEKRADYDTNGEYRVNLPDGRVQIVTYSAGPEGYVADVKYEGEAVYAEVKPYKPAPAPSYKPAPAPYKPAPVVKIAPAPVVKVVPAPAPYKPAPAPYKPAPVVYKPAPVVYKPAPVVYKPAPVPVYHKPTGYHAAPLAPKYTPKKYGYQVVTTPAPAPEVKAAVEEEAAPVVEEAAAPAPVEEAAAPAPAPVEKAAPASEAPIVPAYEAPATTEAAAAAESYRASSWPSPCTQWRQGWSPRSH